MVVEPGVSTCPIHPRKKIKFYCKTDEEMFCSKCLLKHTDMKHEVIECSHKVTKMREEVKSLL